MTQEERLDIVRDILRTFDINIDKYNFYNEQHIRYQLTPQNHFWAYYIEFKHSNLPIGIGVDLMMPDTLDESDPGYEVVDIKFLRFEDDIFYRPIKDE